MPAILLWVLGGLVIIGVVSRRSSGGAPVAPAPTVGVPESIAEPVDDAAFRVALPPEGRRYADVILRVSKEDGISPWLIAAIMEQESKYGTLLTPPGPAGTNRGGDDFGLMQLNVNSHREWLAERLPDGRFKWQDPYWNVKRAVAALRQKQAFFRIKPKAGTKVTIGSYARSKGVPAGTYPDPRPLSGDALDVAALAAYNTGEGNVLQSIAAGMPPDQTAARSHYAGKSLRYAELVIARMADIAARA